jgi:hypothetical protein
MHGKGCRWCRNLAGEYSYPDVPRDVYRRHDNCSCTVTYVTEKGTQDVWNKQYGDTAEERSQKWEKRKVEIADEEAEKKVAREYRDKSVKKIMDYTGMSPKEASIYYNKNKWAMENYSVEETLKLDGYITQDDVVKAYKNSSAGKAAWERLEKLNTYDKMGKKEAKTIAIGDNSYTVRTYKNSLYSNISCQTNSKNSQEICSYLNDKINVKGTYGNIDGIVVAKNDALHGIAAYDHGTNTFVISEELIDESSFKKLVDTNYFAAQNLDDVIEHELGGHKAHWDAIYRYQKSNGIKDAEQAKTDLETYLRKYVITQIENDSGYIYKNVSKNAYVKFNDDGLLNELIADAKIKIVNNDLSDENLQEKVLEVINYDA